MENRNLKPYQALIYTVSCLSKRLNGRTATVNYGDIGIAVKRDTEGPFAGLDKFFVTYAVKIENTPFLVGALAQDFDNRDSNSFIYGFKYNWEEVFSRSSPHSRPRIMPPLEPNVNFMRHQFSEINAYLNNCNGLICAPENANKEVVEKSRMKRIVRDNMRSIDGHIEYNPNVATQLAPVLYGLLVKIQTLPEVRAQLPVSH